MVVASLFFKKPSPEKLENTTFNHSGFQTGNDRFKGSKVVPELSFLVAGIVSGVCFDLGIALLINRKTE